MKAILVIDVNNIDQVNRCYVTVCEDKAQYMIDDVKIKPMPQKKDMSKTYYECGYNDCIDEILGGNE